jgi:hypothetical protein
MNKQHSVDDIRHGIPSDNSAVRDGYTKEVHAFAPEGLELYLLVKPDADLDGHFRAWDMDAQEFITVTGWMFNIEVQ